MTVLLREVRRSGRRSRQAGGGGGGRPKPLIGPVPPPLCRWMADRLPAHDPLLPLHGPLREDEIPSERRRQRRAARGQIPTALGAAPGPTDPAGSGRIGFSRTSGAAPARGDQGKALRCLAFADSYTAPITNRQQARSRPRTSFFSNRITALARLQLHRKFGRTQIPIKFTSPKAHICPSVELRARSGPIACRPGVPAPPC